MLRFCIEAASDTLSRRGKGLASGHDDEQLTRSNTGRKQPRKDAARPRTSTNEAGWFPHPLATLAACNAWGGKKPIPMPLKRCKDVGNGSWHTLASQRLTAASRYRLLLPFTLLLTPLLSTTLIASSIHWLPAMSFSEPFRSQSRAQPCNSHIATSLLDYR